MKTLVTGADGMLGTHVVSELLSRGHEVTAFVYPNSKSKTLQGLNLNVTEGDLLNLGSIESAIAGHDYVVHVAGSTSVWPSRNEFVKNVNIDGTRNMMLVSQKVNIKRFIHVGSANSFASGTKDKWGDETGEYNGWSYKSDYRDSKYLAQKLLLEEFKKNGFPVIVVAPTFMIGEYDSLPGSGRLVLAYKNGKVPGYSKGVKNYIAAKDVAVAIVNAISMGKLGDAYIAGNKHFDYRSFFDLLNNVFNVNPKTRYLPPSLLLAIGIISSISARLIKTRPNLSYGVAKMSTDEQWYSSQKAIDELKLPQSHIKEAIVKCVTWCEKNNVTI